ncbi:MAG: aminodeoxychorismate/anthranilate synthase component II [Bacteroidetes bacterium]|nr:aminodeoxychorismate/anthranilate synthase component II [Bacteroidota bacterium]
MLLLLNNHDSFTWNLAELLRTIGNVSFEIVSSEDFNSAMMPKFDRIIFSPGPGLPQERPAMFTILKEIEERESRREKVPSVLGVCLGMQAIAIHFGAKLINLPSVIHGQSRKLRILRPDNPLFNEIPDGCEVGLYHSWAVDPASIPACLETLAISPDETIMALCHKTIPVTGVQFHPESIMTPTGKKMIENWLGEGSW